MSGEKNKGSEKKQKNIFNYAIIMIISVIIIIIFAAMADNRENEIDNRINETERTNQTNQEEIVRLTNENAALSKQVEENQKIIDNYTSVSQQLIMLSEIWNLYNDGNIEEAKTKAALIDPSTLDENNAGYYNALCAVLNISPADNKTEN